MMSLAAQERSEARRLMRHNVLHVEADGRVLLDLRTAPIACFRCKQDGLADWQDDWLAGAWRTASC